MFVTPFTFMKKAGSAISYCCSVQCFTTNSTWTRCPGTVCIEVVAIGGGGGGRSGICHTAGNPGRSTGGPGGGAGGVSVCTLTTGFGGTQTVVIGPGGASDASGSASCFGALVCAGGGSVGAAAAASSGVGSSTASGGAGGVGNQGTSTAGGGAKACADALASPGNSAAPENAGNDGASAAGFPGAGGGGGGFSQCLSGWFGNGGAGAAGGTICGITLGSGGNGRTSSSQNFTERCGATGTMPGGGGGGGGTNSSNSVVRDGGRGATGMIQVIQYYTPVTPVLDTYPSALEAYSLRLLRTAYAGNAIRVRRSSDNTEQNIGFVNGYLDTASLLSFVGAGNGFITTWYDQSGNARNMTQTTAGNQPRIVTSGSLLTSNGKATISFGTNDDWWLDANALSSQATISLFATWTITDGPSNGGVYGPSATAGIGLELIQSTTKPTTLRINGTERATGATTAGRLWTSATQTVTSILGNSTSVAAYKNDASVTMTDSSAMPTLNSSASTSLGRYYDVTSYNMYGNVQEWVIWTSNQTSNVSAINSNINSYYGTY